MQLGLEEFLRRLHDVVEAQPLLLTLLVVTKSMSTRMWTELAPSISGERYAEALNVFLDGWAKSTILAAAILLVSIIILAKPASSGKAG